MEAILLDKEIQLLINQLGTKDGYKRERARKALVKIGKPAVPLLIKLISDQKPLIRWEACKTLGEIQDPKAAEALVSALRDEASEVSWVAAEALITLKTDVLVPLLRSLQSNFDSFHIKQGAHHILHALERENLLNKETLSILDALRSYTPRISVALAARRALLSLDKSQSGISIARK